MKQLQFRYLLFLSIINILLLNVVCIKQDQPNIITIVIDDLGWNDISYHNPLFSTPNIELMAREGIILNNFYTYPSCTPSRAAFMTGRYSIHTGLQDSVIHSTEPRGVPLSEVFISSKLKDVGYKTYAVGKWHLGMHTDEYLPLNRGFDYHYGIYTGGGSHTQHFSVSQSFTPSGYEDDVVFSGYNLWDEGKMSEDNYGGIHSTYLYNSRAVQYINAANKNTEPFFMYLAYQAVHDPIEVGNEEMISQTTCNEITRDELDSSSIDWDNRKIFCGMVAEIDVGIGNIRSILEELDEWENTLIFFFSDNGGNPSHGSSNYPLAGSKGEYRQGGVKVPAFIGGGYVSEKLQQLNNKPYEYDSLVHVTDFHQTILTVAGFNKDDNNGDNDILLDGIDLWDALIMTKESKRTELLININSEKFGGSGAIIVGDYKLIKNYDPKESIIYAKVRNQFSGLTENIWTKSNLDTILEDVLQSVFPEDEYYLFNIKKNPTETIHGDCDDVNDDVEECTNLYNDPKFSNIRSELESKWNEYLKTMIESTFSWQDDGVLANPEWFSGIWTPWREIGGTPKAVYLGNSQIVIKSDVVNSLLSWMDIDYKTCLENTELQTTNPINALLPFISTTPLLTFYVAFIMFIAAIIGYKIGKRTNYHHLP